MSEQRDDVEKSEDPTPHRREKARKEGRIPRSKELTSVALLLVGWMLLFFGGQQLVLRLARLLRNGLKFNSDLLCDMNMVFLQFYHSVNIVLFGLIPLMAGLFIAAFFTPLLIGGIYLNRTPVKIDFKRLSLLSGIKRLLSITVIIEFIKTVLKVALVTCASVFFILQNKMGLLALLKQPMNEALADALTLIFNHLLIVIICLAPIAAYDIFHQLTSHLKKLRMSRQEIRDELKQHEGDPLIKGRIRQLQQAAARRRMMTDIVKADVIINNPTHYSVALHYENKKMSVPIILAKGAGEVALRIRELGKENRILMLEAAPLARALYKYCELGQPIPASLYCAVAEVLAWVYSIKRWRNNGGIKPRTPVKISLPENMDIQIRE